MRSNRSPRSTDPAEDVAQYDADDRWKPFGAWIRRRREALGLTQLEAAKRAGIATKHAGQQWYNWESRGKAISRTSVESIARALQADVNETLRQAGYLVDQSALPEALRSAVHNYALRQEDTPGWASLPPPKVVAIKIPYTDIEAVAQLQDELVQYIKKNMVGNGTASQQPIVIDNTLGRIDCADGQEKSELDAEGAAKSGGDYRAVVAFDAIVRPEVATYFRAIYTFPFYLGAFRQKSWGVIPYGTQHWTGLLLNKGHPLYLDLQELDPRRTPQGLGDSGADNWVVRLLEWLNKNHGLLYATLGYVHLDVVAYMALSKGTEESKAHYIQCVRSLYPSSIAALRKLIDSREAAKADVMVIDLVEGPTYLDQFGREEYDVLALPHYMAMPVGIGFSLHAVPELRDGHHWDRLAGIAKEVLERNPVTKMKFADVGIKLNTKLALRGLLGEEYKDIPSLI